MINQEAMQGRREALFARIPQKGQLFLAAFSVVFLAGRILALLPGYALDDYYTGLHTTGDLNAMLLSQGRYVFALLNTVIAKAGLQQTDFSGIGYVLVLAFSALYSWATFRSSLVKCSPAWVVGIAALLASYPYLTEYLTFRQSLLPMGLMFAGCYVAVECYGLAVRSTSVRAKAAICGLAAALFAIGLNQLALPLICISILFHESQRLTDTETAAQPIMRDLAAAGTRILATGVILALGYFLVSAVASASFGGIASDDRATFLAASQISERISQIATLLNSLLAGPDAMASMMIKAGVGVALAWLAVAALIGQRWRLTAFTLLYFVAALFLAITPIAAGSVWWPVPRTLIGVPLAAAGAIALLAALPARPKLASIALAPLCLSALLFTGLNHSMLLDQQRLNRWDIANAQSVAATILERHPQAINQKILISGAPYSYPVAPLMAQGDMNVSAMSIGWSIDPLFEEATGRKLDVGTSEMATQMCTGRPKYPARESIFEAGGQVIACL